MTKRFSALDGRAQKLWSWAFLAPALILLLVFSYFPLVKAFGLSFQRWDLLSPPRFVGLREYERLLSSSEFAASVKVTVAFTAMNVVGTYLLALGTALLLQRTSRWAKLVRTIALFPAVTPMIIAGIVWRWMFEPTNGILNAVLALGGVDGPSWLFDPRFALPAVVTVTIWRDFGIYMLVLLGGLLQVPTEVNEASEVDGCTGLRRLWYVTLPCIKHANIFVVILLLFNSLKSYDQIWVMTEGGPGTATTTILTLVFKYIRASNIGGAAAASMILFALVLAAAIARGVFSRKAGEYA